MEAIVGVFFAAMSAILFVVASQIPATRLTQGIGAAAWPQCLLAGIFILSVAMVVRSVRANGGVKINAGWLRHNAKVWLACLVLWLYLALLNQIGFVLASTLLVAALMFMLGCRRPVLLILVPAVTPLVIEFIFFRLMGVPLPLGTGFFRQLSLFLMTGRF